MSKKVQHGITRKLRVFNHAKEIGKVAKASRYFGISLDTFYQTG